MRNTNLPADAHAALKLSFGLAQVDITPPLEIYARNWGAAKSDTATGLHQPLYLSCLVTYHKDGQKGVVLTADLGWWKDNNDERNLRTAILETCRLQEEQLLLCLSHTHAGPSICSNDKNQTGGEYIAPYLDFLKHTAISSIQQAEANLMEGMLTWTYGCCDLATKRDLNHEGQFLIGYDPGQKADQTLLVGQLRDMEGEIKALICNYACHPTTFAHENTLLSPDYVGAMRQLIYDTLEVPCLFLQGASGDLAPKKQYVKDPAIVEANGKKLAYAMLSTLENSSAIDEQWTFDQALQSGAPLALFAEKKIEPSSVFKQVKIEVTVPYKKLPSVAEITAEFEACEDRVMKDRLWRKLNTRKSIADQTHAQIPVWIWQFGDAFLVAQPNEVYAVFQEQVRAHFPNRFIAVVNIANGYLGYLPPQDLYQNDMYAVWQTPFEKGSLEILINATITNIEKLIADEIRFN